MTVESSSTPFLPLYDDNGQVIALVETSFDSSDQADLGLLRGIAPADASERLQQAGETIALTCRKVLSAVQSGLATTRPSEFTLEFGVKLGGEIGVPVLTKSRAEATLKVTAKWVESTTPAE